VNALFLACGATFGFLLSRSRVTDYETMLAFFRLRDLHVGGVMAVAIAVAAIGLAVLERFAARSAVGAPIELGAKPMTPGLFAASLVFGVGWALTGA
jgi:uncharacterized membrane protein YedE/YeeE